MNNQNYTCTISVPVDAATAFNAITEVNQWWAKNFEGRAEETGDIFTVRFGETFVTFQLAEVTPAQKMVWNVTDCYLHWLQDKTEWNGTSIAFTLKQKDGDTQITMTHTGLVPGIECFEKCEAGWNHFIGQSLHHLMTEQLGVPQ
jgi:hypothetical protein